MGKLNGRVARLEEQANALPAAPTEADRRRVLEWVSETLHHILDGDGRPWMGKIYMVPGGGLVTYLTYRPNVWPAWRALQRFTDHHGGQLNDVEDVRYWLGRFDEERKEP